MEKNYALFLTRISLGLVFFWAFIDKAFGLGFSTCRDKVSGEYLGILCEKAWFSGGSPTFGFLKGAAGTFGGVFNNLASQNPLGIVNMLFMIGLLGIGLALLLGIGMRVAAYSGSILLVLMWLAELPLANNPIIDDHIVYAFVLFVLVWANAGEHFGLGRRWKNSDLVQNYPWLE